MRLRAGGGGATRVELQQTTAPETPVPRLLQGMLRSFVDREAEETIEHFLTNVKRRLEST